MSSTPQSTSSSLPSSPINPSHPTPDLISPISSDHEHESSEDEGIHSDWSPSSHSNDAVEGRKDGDEELDYDMLASQDWSEVSSGLSNLNSQSISGESNGTGRSISEGEEGGNSEGDVSIISGLQSQSTDSTGGRSDDEDAKENSRMRLSFPDPLDASNLENHTSTSTPRLESRIKRRSTITMSTQTDINDEVDTEYSFLLASTTNEDSVATLPLVSAISRTSTPSLFSPPISTKDLAVDSSTFVSALPTTTATSTIINRKTKKSSLVAGSSSSSFINTGRDSQDISKWVESSGSYSEAMKKSGELSKVKEKEKEMEEIPVVVEKAELSEKKEVKFDKINVATRNSSSSSSSEALNRKLPVEEETKGLPHLLKTLIDEEVFEWLGILLGIPILVIIVIMISRSITPPPNSNTSRSIIQTVTSTSTILHYTTSIVTSTTTVTIATPMTTSVAPTCSPFVRKSIKKVENEEFRKGKLRRKKEASEKKISRKLKLDKEKLESNNSNSSDYQCYQNQMMRNFAETAFNFSSFTSLFENFSLDAQLELLRNLSMSNQSKSTMEKIDRMLLKLKNSIRITRATKGARLLSKLLEKEFKSKAERFESFLDSSSSVLQNRDFINKLRESVKNITSQARHSTRRARKNFTENPKSPFKRLRQIDYYLGHSVFNLGQECLRRINQFTTMLNAYEKELTQESVLHRVKVASGVFQKLKRCDLKRRQKVFRELEELQSFGKKWNSVVACIHESKDSSARRKCDALATAFSQSK